MASLSDSVVAGAVSGSFTRLVTEPLDVLKVRFQLQVEPIHKKSTISKYRGLHHALRTIIREEGPRALWKGLIPGQLLYIVYGAVQFGTFSACRKATHPLQECTASETALNFTCGCAAGCAAGVASYAFDVLRTRFIGQGEPKLYNTLFDAVRQMYPESGARTFYKGMSPALLAVVPQTGLNFGFYHLFTNLWNTIDTQTEEVSYVRMRSVVCGSLTGFISKTATLPFDITKKRLQVQGFEKARSSFGSTPQYFGAIHCVHSIVRNEGVLALYKGMSPSIIKASISVALSFTAYEETLRLISQLK